METSPTSATDQFGPAPSTDQVYQSLYTARERERLDLDDQTGVWDVASQFGTGFVQGFTTLRFGEDPKSTTEAIANNLGHLFGFIGVVPGLGSVGSIAAKGAARGLGLASRTVGLGSKAARYGKKGVNALGQFRSVPMMAGDAVLKGAKKIGQTKAGGAAMKYLQRSPTLKKAFGEAGIGRDVAEGFLHMGTAGAASAWQGGADAMMESFLYTGAFGSADRIMANLIPHKGPGTPDLSTLMEGGDDAARMAARGISLGAFQGGIATARGAPLEMQLYEYLLGAWFGGKEISRPQRKAYDFLRPYMADPKKRAEAVGRAQRQAMDTEMAAKQRELMFSETLPGYEDLRPSVQDYVDVESDAQFGKFMMLPDSPLANEEGMGGAMEAQVAAARAIRETVQKMEEDGARGEDIQAYLDEYRKAEAESARRWQANQQSSAEEGAGATAAEEGRTTGPDVRDLDDGELTWLAERLAARADEGTTPEERVQGGAERQEQQEPRLREVREELNRRDAERRPERQEKARRLRDEIDRIENGDPEKVQQEFDNPRERLNENAKEVARLLAEDPKLRDNLENDRRAFKVAESIGNSMNPEDFRQTPKKEPEDEVKEAFLGTEAGDQATPDMGLDLNTFLRQAGLPERQEAARTQEQERLSSPVRAVQRAVEDHNIPAELASPVMQFSRRLYENNPDFEPAPEKLFIETLTSAKLHYEQDGNDGFEPFVDEMRQRYDVDIDDAARNELRKQWLRGAHNKPENQLTIDLTGDGPTLTETPPVDQRGQRTARSRPPSFMEQQTGRRAALENIEVEVGPGDIDPRSGFERPDDAPVERVTAGVFDAVEHGYITMGELTRMAEDQGLVIHSGVKDKGRLVVTRAEMQPDEAMAYMREQREKMREVDEALGEANDRVSADEVWRQNYQDFAQARNLNPKAQSTKRRYAYHWANNARRFEQMNGGMEWAEMYRHVRDGTGQFMLGKGVTEFNKRMQVIDAGDVPITNDAWKPVDDIEDGQGLRISLINSVPSGAEDGSGIKYQVEGEDLITYFRRNDRGEVVEAVHDQHMDGVYFLRDDVFDAINEYGGWPGDTGAQKGVTVQADDNGMLLGKYAYHRAGPELSKAMKERGQHGLMTSEASKQTGTREKYDTQFTQDGGLKFYREGSTRPIEPETYEIKDGAMTISQGTGEKGNPKDVRLPAQVSTNMNRFQAEDGANSAYDNFHRPGFEGQALANERVSQYRDLMVERAETDDTARQREIDKELEEMARDLDPEDVGVQAMLDFFNADVQSANPVFEKMARHILDLQPEDVLPESFESREVQQVMKELTEQQSAANIITQAADELTPAVVGHKLVRPYFESALRGYIVTKTVRPKVKHSWKSIMAPYHSDIRRDMDLERDSFLLHEGMKEKEIKWGEETTTLGEAWSEFQEAGGWKSAPAQMQKDMTMAAMRAPADSISGTQPLRFAGFTGTDGYGAVMHPKTMEYLGGADLDIDSAFFFQSLPDGMMSAIQRNRKEWEETLPDGRDVLKVAKNKDEDFVQRYSSDPDENARLEAIQGHPVSMNDPMKRMEAGMGANRGNKLLGFGLNAAKRWHVIAEESDGTVGGALRGAAEDFEKAMNERLREKGIDPQNATLRWTGRLKEDEGATIRSYKRDVVNYAADAANYAGLISRYDIADLIGRKAMRDVTVYAETENGQRVTLTRLGTDSELPFSVSGNDAYRSMSTADKFLKGRNYQDGTAFSLREVITGLKDVSRELPRQPTNTWYRIAQDFAGLREPSEFRMLKDSRLEEGRMAIPSWLGDQYINFKEVFDRVWEEDTAVAQLARTLVSRRDLKVFTENRGEHPAQRFESAAPEGRETPIVRPRDDVDAERAKDFPVNDLTDVVSAVEGVRIGRKMVDEMGKERATAVAQRLAQKAYELRSEAAKLLGRSQKRKDEREEYVSRKDAVAAVVDDAHAFVDGLNKLEREFFETYLMGSLRPQSEGLMNQERRALLERLSTADEREQQQAIERALDEQKKEWYSTNQTASSLLLGVVRNETVRNFMGRYNEVVQATRKKNLTKADLREAIQRGTSMERLAQKVEAVEGASGGMEAEAQAEKWTREVFDQIAPELANAEGELSERGQRMKDRLKTLFYNNPRLMRDFAQAAPGIIGKQRSMEVGTAPESMTLADLEQYVSFFDQAGKHDIWGMSPEERKEMPLELKRRHYFPFPATIAKQHLPFDRGKVTLEAPVYTGDGVQKGDVDVYLSKIGQMHQFWTKTYRHVDRETNAEEAKLVKEFEMIESLGREGEILWDAAVAVRERREKGDDDHYEKEYQRAMKRLDKEGLRDKRFNVTINGKKRSLTGEQLIQRVNERITDWSEYMYNKYVENPQGKSVLVYKDGQDDLPEDQREIDTRATMARINEQVIRGSDPPVIGFNTLSRISHQYLLDKTEVKVERGQGEFETIRLGDIEDTQLRLKKRADLMKGRPDLQFERTGQRDPTTYWPHNGHPQESVRKAVEQQIKEAQAEGASEVQKDKVEMRAKATAQRQNAPDGGALSPERAEQMDRRTISQDEVDTRGLMYKPGHLMSRGSFGDKTLPGYRRDLEALSTYQRQVINAHYKMIADLMSRTAIDSFRKQKPMGEWTDAWANFMSIYNRDQIGFPSIFPEEWVKDPKMKLGGEGLFGQGYVASNPYYWFTDDAVQQKAKWLGKKIGFDKENVEGDTKREARSNMGKREKMGSYFHDGELVSQKIRQFSQWEGKWQLMSLLAHTKSYVNNIVGGNIHTAINSGMRPWRKAGDVGYLRNVAGLDIQTKEGRDRFVEEHGGVENWIVNEVNMSRRFRTDKMQNFADDVMRAVKKDPQLEDATLMEMAERRGLSQTVMNGAAFFMRKSERILRSRSFMAHYAKAVETLGMGGSAFKPDHPWLIRQANRGVQATQFLYHNAARPAFSRTPLGRIFSRFQLFTWNSVRFRKRIYDQAKAVGYEVPEGPSIPYGQGPPAFRKMQRLMTADLFMLGLASLFPYSMFESSLPPHFEWFTSLSALMFGDEQESERAFFNTGKLGPLAPLQAIQPPSTRILQPMFIAMMEDDWSRFVDYHIPTLLPFGRLSRNVYRTYKNPIRVSEEMMGVPVIDAQRKLRELREKDDYLRPFQTEPPSDSN